MKNNTRKVKKKIQELIELLLFKVYKMLDEQKTWF